MSQHSLKAVIFDWAGTLVDYGSRAPMGVFVASFKEFGVDITVEEARGPMGMAKWDHIKAVGSEPRIAQRWQAVHGAPFSDKDVDRIYEVFVPMNVKVVTDYAAVIPGVPEMLSSLRDRGLKIGSTTGYTREIMAPLLPLAAEQGVAPDNLICAGDLSHGRPTPAMMYRTFLDLEVWPASSCVKLDDTPVGIGEGLSAGTWTVGVAVTGNAFGLSREEIEALAPETFATRRAAAVAQLSRAGAHYVIDSAAGLLPVLDEIEGRLARGERP